MKTKRNADLGFRKKEMKMSLKEMTYFGKNKALIFAYLEIFIKKKKKKGRNTILKVVYIF